MMLLYIVTALVGFLLGLIFFGGLWLSLKHFLSRKGAGFWIIGIYLVRLAVCVVAFAFIAINFTYIYLLTALAGFIAAKYMCRYVVGRNQQRGSPLNI